MSYFRNFTNDLALDNGIAIPESQVTNLVEDLQSTGSGLLVRQNSPAISVDASAITSGTIPAAYLSSKVYVQAADPGGTVSADIGKFWFDTTTTTTVLKVCKNVAGTIGWVTI